MGRRKEREAKLWPGSGRRREGQRRGQRGGAVACGGSGQAKERSGADAGDQARSIWKPWGGAAGMGGSRERRLVIGAMGKARRRQVAWLHWDPEEDLESGGARGKDGTSLLNFWVGLIHI